MWKGICQRKDGKYAARYTAKNQNCCLEFWNMWIAGQEKPNIYV